MLDSETPQWEVCKENVAPRKLGRDPKKLERGLQAAEKHEPVVEISQVEAFEAEILEATSDSPDPLEPWLRYIPWLEEAFVSDDSKAFEARERCARTFKDSEEYRNDPRYVDVWIGYAEQLEKAEEAFRYLHKRKIGAQVAAFWAAWAISAERSGRRKLASDLYARGISKDAASEDGVSLEKKLEEFEQRIARRLAAEALEPESSTSAPDARPALAQRKAPRRVAPPRDNNAASSRPAAAAASQEPQQQQQPATAAGFTVFVDQSSASDGQGAADLDGAVEDVWPDFGSRCHRTKENTLRPTRWTESALGKKVGKPNKRKAPEPTFQVFDEGAGEEAPAA